MSLLLAFVLTLQDPPTVGLPRTLRDVVLPGSELEAKPLVDARAPLVLRVAAAAPHGSAHRYTLVYYGLEPGSYDLRDLLRRKDGASLEGVPPIPVSILPAYPRGDRRAVSDIALSPLGRFGGYRAMLWTGAVLWMLGLAVLLFARRRRRTATAEAPAPLTVADRLRPLAEQARLRGLSPDEQARLERLLIAFWRERAGLGGLDHVEALTRLRTLEPGGTLLRALERRLHHPAAEEIDLAALLAPYAREAAP